MQRALFRSLLIAIALVLTPISSVFSQTPAPGTANAQMQEMMKLMMPGAGHQPLAKMVGKWNGKMKIWNSAALAQPPMESVDDSESKLILGGRFLLEESKGSMMGMPMQRMSLLGYDNYKKVYTQVFISSMGTPTNIAQGTFDATGKVLTLRGEFDEPHGKEPFKNVVRFESDDVRVFESYKILPDGKELKLVEVTFTRAK